MPRQLLLSWLSGDTCDLMIPSWGEPQGQSLRSPVGDMRRLSATSHHSLGHSAYEGGGHRCGLHILRRGRRRLESGGDSSAGVHQHLRPSGPTALSRSKSDDILGRRHRRGGPTHRGAVPGWRGRGGKNRDLRACKIRIRHPPLLLVCDEITQGGPARVGERLVCHLHGRNHGRLGAHGENGGVGAIHIFTRLLLQYLSHSGFFPRDVLVDLNLVGSRAGGVRNLLALFLPAVAHGPWPNYTFLYFFIFA
jgi:hypothetical protein